MGYDGFVLPPDDLLHAHRQPSFRNWLGGPHVWRIDGRYAAFGAGQNGVGAERGRGKREGLRWYGHWERELWKVGGAAWLGRAEGRAQAEARRCSAERGVGAERHGRGWMRYVLEEDAVVVVVKVKG